MNRDMLWFDRNPQTSVIQKMELAVAYYTKKYGVKPTLCLASSKQLETSCKISDSLILQPYKSIPIWRFWIGQEDNF